MHIAAILLGCIVLSGVLLDAFQTIILPRRPVHRFRITRIFFLITWPPLGLVARALPSRSSREQLYSIYGPAALLLLFVLWAAMLTFGYAFLYFGLHTPFADPMHPASALAHFRTCLYASGTTIFTLGLGDVLPTNHSARALIVMEAGTGLGFVALVIGYVPVLYTAFSNREIAVALLDARAGSPPTAGELLVRHNFQGGHNALSTLLEEWERWCALMLETHISYPILCYYRSQHDNQSWLSALTAVLDTCALLITSVDNPNTRQAQLTFAIGRHVLVDLGHVFRLEKNEQRYRDEPLTRLSDEEYARLCGMLSGAGFDLCGDVDMHARLSAVRKLYEPSATALASYLKLGLPLWAPPPADPNRKRDQWTTVAELRSPAALADQLNTYVSRQSTATHIHDEDTHPL